jgi:hypothetical protein
MRFTFIGWTDELFNVTIGYSCLKVLLHAFGAVDVMTLVELNTIFA